MTNRLTCPYCGTKFTKQVAAVIHIRECPNRRRALNAEPECPDPKVPWELNLNDRNLLKGLRISDE